MLKGMAPLLSPFKLYRDQYPDYRFIIVIFFSIQIFIGLEYGLKISERYRNIGILFNYLISFSTFLIMYVWLKREAKFLRSLKFWILSFSVIFSLFLFETSEYHTEIIKNFCPRDYIYIGYKIITQVRALVFFSIPFLIYISLYGLPKVMRLDENNSRYFLNIPLTSYLYLLVPMILAVMVVSLSGDFQDFYPRAPKDLPEIGFVATTGYILLFESFYILAFVATEWFFRGFLIKTYSEFFGKESILFMTVFYVIIHYEKPILETISSSFGGFALGIFSYYTGKIRGGVLVHVGIALTMEIMGFYWMGKF